MPCSYTARAQSVLASITVLLGITFQLYVECLLWVEHRNRRCEKFPEAKEETEGLFENS